MRATPRKPAVREKLMPFALRPMRETDALQAEEIERDAFPTMLPRTAFRRELSHPIARYLAAYRRWPVDPPAAVRDTPTGQSWVVGRIVGGVRGLLGGAPARVSLDVDFIAGYIGVWYMVEEAHVVSVGVRTGYRGQGIGEMLLVGAIEQAMDRGSRCVTLEVRVSNHVAINLYHKYGFKEVGLRKAYYADNREDALIMTTAPIAASPYPEDLRRLTQQHEARWGRTHRTVR